MKTFFWDFFGPRAEGTAKHFLVHLLEFLEKHEFDGCETGLESRAPNHHAAWCRAPEQWHDGLQKALKPKRSEGSD